MLHTLQGFVPVKDLEFILAWSHSTREQTMCNSLGRYRFFRRGIHLNAITSREKKGFRTSDFIPQSGVNRCVAGKPLTRFHVGSVMTDPDAEQIHQVVWFWERNVMPQSNVNAALKAMTQRAAIRRGAILLRWRASRIAA
jgi:hypothetical protein